MRTLETRSKDGAAESLGVEAERAHLIPQTIWSFGLDIQAWFSRRCILNAIFGEEHGPGELEARCFADLESLVELVVAGWIVISGGSRGLDRVIAFIARFHDCCAAEFDVCGLEDPWC